MGQRDNLYLIAEDLGERKLMGLLKANASWDQCARTVIVAEGLVMYLPAEAVRDLLYHCADITGIGSRIAFTYPYWCGWQARRWTGTILWLQKVIGEPWTWSIRPDELDLFLEELGWTYSQALVGTPRKHGVDYYAVAVN